MKYARYTLIFFALITQLSCHFDEDVDKAVGEIDKAITDINRTSVGWQNIITKLDADLPGQAHAVIGEDLDQLGRDVVGATTASAMCTIDFVKTRAIQTLENLKAKLLKHPYPALTPGFCTLTVPSLDMNNPVENKNLNIFGFDLNARDPKNARIRAALYGPTAYMKIPEDLIGRSTNYELAVNIAALWPELLKNKYSKIKFYWNDDSTNMPEVLIETWEAKTKAVQVTPQSISFTPPLIGGDVDFDTKPGNWASGSTHMEFMIDSASRSLLARVYMQAMEFGGDNTQVKGYSPWRVLYTEPDRRYRLVDFTPDTPSDQPFSFTTQGPTDFYPAGSVARYTIQIDHKGDDAGTYTMVIVNLNQFVVNEIEVLPS